MKAPRNRIRRHARKPAAPRQRPPRPDHVTVGLREFGLGGIGDLEPRFGVGLVCRICGCTDADCSGCIDRTGSPCWWVDTYNLPEAGPVCSACYFGTGEVEPHGILTRRKLRWMRVAYWFHCRFRVFGWIFRLLRR
jgi:hypothetical protein